MTLPKNRRSTPGRRAFLGKLALALGSMTAGVWSRSYAMDSGLAPDHQVAAAASRLIRHPESAAAIGSAYLSVHGQRTVQSLLGEISARIERHFDDGRAIDANKLVELIRSDFERGDVVTLDGWILSRTEAQICALYAR